MPCYIIAEGSTDVVILQALLQPELSISPIEFFSTGAKSGVDSLARSILVVQREPVIAVMDTDTTDPNGIDEQRDFFTQSLGEVAPRDLWRVCLAVPEIEICFFHDIAATERLFQVTLPEEARMRARVQPKAVLTDLMKQLGRNYTPQHLQTLLDGQDLSAFRESPVIREVRQAVQAIAPKTREPLSSKPG
jgi:hypothetical protein